MCEGGLRGGSSAQCCPRVSVATKGKAWKEVGATGRQILVPLTDAPDGNVFTCAIRLPAIEQGETRRLPVRVAAAGTPPLAQQVPVHTVDYSKSQGRSQN